MEVATITMDPEVAKAKVQAYRDALRTGRSAEDVKILAGFRAAADGRPVIRLSEAIGKGGRFDNSLPKLAVARAGTELCWVEVEPSQGLIVYRDSEPAMNRGAMVGELTVRVRVHPWQGPSHNRWRGDDGVATVPNIPPEHWPRPHRGKRSLDRFHVLWEVEEWRPVPPRDPMLLKHIGGDLWAVHAQWDLTEIERAVLAGRSS